MALVRWVSLWAMTSMVARLHEQRSEEPCGLRRHR
jgi:hypothetical protein